MESPNNTQSVIQHHLSAFSENNVEEIMKDYTEASCVCTPDGKLSGLAAIKSFYNNVIPLFPAGKTELEIKQMIFHDDKAYLSWNSDSPVASIPLGTDSFEIKDGKITWQTMAAQIIIK